MVITLVQGTTSCLIVRTSLKIFLKVGVFFMSMTASHCNADNIQSDLLKCGSHHAIPLLKTLYHRPIALRVKSRIPDMASRFPHTLSCPLPYPIPDYTLDCWPRSRPIKHFLASKTLPLLFPLHLLLHLFASLDPSYLSSLS